MAFPADLATVTVAGTYVTNGEVPVTGTIEFTSTTRVVSDATHTAVVPGGTVDHPDPVTGTLVGGVLFAEDGLAPLELLATDDADGSPVGWVWSVKERFTNAFSQDAFNLSVPSAAGTIYLPEVTPGLPPVIPAGTAVVKIGDVVPNGVGVIVGGLTPGHGIPATMPPSAHSHPTSGVTGLDAALADKETAGAAAAAVAAHLLAADPHSQYLLPSEANAVYALIAHSHNVNELHGLPIVAAFGMGGPVEEKVGQGKWRNRTGLTLNITAFSADVGTAPTGGPMTVELKKNGAAFGAGGHTTVSIASAGTAAVFYPTALQLADGDYLSVDVTLVGLTVPGSDLTVGVSLAVA